MISNSSLDIFNKSRESYVNESPYPHIVIDDFLSIDVLHPIQKEAYEVCDNPNDIWRFGGGRFKDDAHDFQQKKRAIGILENLPTNTRNLVTYLNSDDFIDKLSKLTGKAGLVSDPSLTGGGLHETRPGGYLGIHHDFNLLEMNGESYYRQINLLLYINPHWDNEWGGSLELWNSDMSGAERVVDIKSNRCVIFNIDGAPHGHPSELKSPNDISRRSIAMYYYSKEEPKFSKIKRAHWEPELKQMF